MATLTEQIHNLTTPQKIEAMEALWSSLHQTFEDAAPPDWHRKLLESRMNLIQSGGAVYEDWNEVKRQLRNRIA